jgi:tetratricopeptide (TPR) repeat protein
LEEEMVMYHVLTIAHDQVSLDEVGAALEPPLQAEEFAPELALLRLAANGPESDEQWRDYLAALKRVGEGFLATFGQRLFDRVFVGAVGERYRTTAGHLVLAFDEDTKAEPSLGNLPWELLYDGTGWVARDRGILRMAQVDVLAGSGEAPPGDRLRVLVAMASPLLNEALEPDDPRQPYVVDLEREAEVFRALDGASFPADFVLRLHVTRQDLSWELGGDYHVLHFLGHGNVGRLALEDRHGVEDVVRTAWLRERVLRTGLGLAVLQSCLTAADAPLVPGVARTLLEAGLPRVLAMQHSISVAGARAFFARFYAELARVDLLEALRRARHALADDYDVYHSRKSVFEQQVRPWEWATPVLWIRREALGASEAWPVLSGQSKDPVTVEERPRRPSLNPMMQREERFVGRRAELVAVARGMDPKADGGSRVVLLHGEGGMGKTAIAIEAAHRWAGWFKQVVWVSGRGKRAPEEVEPHLAAYARERLAADEGAFLADLAEELELPRGTPVPDILRTLADGKQRLLVLDNLDPFARSAAMLDLLSHLPRGCRALVTSRVRPNVDAWEVPVRALPFIDAARLVGAYAEQRGLPLKPEQRIQLHHITGGHPQTLRLVVAQVTSGAKTWDRALADLRRAEGPVFDYVFADSLNLAEELAGEAGPRLFRLLAAFVPWAARDALRATGVFDEATLGQALKALLDLALVEGYPGDRFGLQELALAKAGRLLHAAFPEDREGLLRAVAWAHRRGEWPLVVCLAGNLAPFYSIRALWADWQRSHELALDAARWLGDRHGEGTTLMNIGNVYQAQGRWDEAIECYEESLRICRDLGDRHGEGQTLGNLGLVYEAQGRWAEAIECYEESLAIFRELGDRHGEGTTLMNIGNVLRVQGQ